MFFSSLLLFFIISFSTSLSYSSIFFFTFLIYQTYCQNNFFKDTARVSKVSYNSIFFCYRSELGLVVTQIFFVESFDILFYKNYGDQIKLEKLIKHFLKDEILFVGVSIIHKSMKKQQNKVKNKYINKTTTFLNCYKYKFNMFDLKYYLKYIFIIFCVQ